MAFVDRDVLRAAIALLGHAEGDATELGFIEMGGEKRKVWGLYTDRDALVEKVAPSQDDVKCNVYLGVNPRPQKLPGMLTNDLVHYVRAKASDIRHVTSILTDIDPVRPKDAASTDVELAHARAVADKVCSWAEARGLQRPVRAMSGNGVQIWWALPRTEVDAHEGLAKKLKAFNDLLQEKFSTPAAKIDQTADLPRICKAIGTTSLKGESTSDRPHRKTYFLDPPVRVEDQRLLEYILSFEAQPDAPPVPPSESFLKVKPEEICGGVKQLLEHGHPDGDRSAGIHWLVGALHAARASFEQTVEIVQEYDRRHGEKLKSRNAAEYVKRSWDKANGKIPCGKIRSAGYCPRHCDLEGGARAFEVTKGNGHLAIQAAIEALSRDPRIYVRGQKLVTVTAWDNEEGEIRRDSSAPIIAQISRGNLWEILSEDIRWMRFDARAKMTVRCDPPDKVVDACHARPEWPGVRQLVGITTSPILRSDGTVVQTPGFDRESGLFYVPDGPPPTIGTDPIAAAAALLDVVKDFPCYRPMDAAGWLAALLTPIARPLTPCVPLTCIDANCPGTGKSLLTDVISTIVAGRGMARGTYVESDDEMRKRIFSHGIAGDTMVLIDNVPEKATVGWPSLDRTLTGTELTDRVLGKSENSAHTNTMTFYLTGNNLLLSGDVVRRAMHICLSTSLEHPERRPATDFAHPQLLQWVREHRTVLLGHCLTILSLYLRQVKAPVEEVLLGSFEEWSQIVRGSVLWTTGMDVLELLANKNDELDGAAQAHIALLETLHKYPRGLTASEIVMADDPDLRDAAAEILGDEKLTPGSLGYALRSLRGRVRNVKGIGAVCVATASKGRSKVASRWVIKAPEAEKEI